MAQTPVPRGERTIVWGAQKSEQVITLFTAQGAPDRQHCGIVKPQGAQVPVRTKIVGCPLSPDRLSEYILELGSK